jgi:hypothetical protein
VPEEAEAADLLALKDQLEVIIQALVQKSGAPDARERADQPPGAADDAPG